MQFIKISNEAEFVNRLYLEKLGLSTKRDDANTIGQFGSGSKFAPIAALRSGIRWVSVGEDERGPYELEFVVQENDGINEVFCLYDREKLKATSFTLEAGMLSWDDSAFQIFREAFANALDEFTARGAKFSVEYVDQIKYEPGQFSVYVTATPELRDIVDNFDKYFCVNRDIITHPRYYTTQAILEPYDAEINVYAKGVLVYSPSENTNAYAPIFNYQFDNITLNEERRVRYESDVHMSIITAFDNLCDSVVEHVEIAERIIRMDGMKKFELENLDPTKLGHHYCADEDNAFKQAFTNIYGDDFAIYPYAEKDCKDLIKINGLKAKGIKSDFLYVLLVNAGVTSYESLVETPPEFELLVLPEPQQQMYNKACELVTAFQPRYAELDVKFFIPHGEQDRVFGVARVGTNEVMISIRAFQSPQILVGTMIHEFDHIDNCHAEHDSGFRGYADNHIGTLLTLESDLF